MNFRGVFDELAGFKVIFTLLLGKRRGTVTIEMSDTTISDYNELHPDYSPITVITIADSTDYMITSHYIDCACLDIFVTSEILNFPDVIVMSSTYSGLFPHPSLMIHVTTEGIPKGCYIIFRQHRNCL